MHPACLVLLPQIHRLYEIFLIDTQTASPERPRQVAGYVSAYSPSRTIHWDRMPTISGNWGPNRNSIALFPIRPF